MIDAFRKDFLRSEADWQTERKKFGRNRFGSETLSFFFVKALEAGTRGEEVIKNLSRIWRPFFFIGVLHFPRCTHYLPAPSSSFPHRYSLTRFLYPLPISPFIRLRIFPFSLSSKLGSGLFEFRDVPHICFLQRFPFHEKHEYTSRRRSRHGGRSRTLTIMEKLIERYLIILLSENGSFRISTTWHGPRPSIILDRYLVKRYMIL